MILRIDVYSYSALRLRLPAFKLSRDKIISLSIHFFPLKSTFKLLLLFDRIQA